MSEARHRPPPRRWRLRAPHLPKAEWIVATTMVFVVIFLGWLAVQVVSLTHELSTANVARDALARQVQGLGEKPVAGPPGSRGTAGQSVIGPQGPSGPPGSAGSPGAPGPTSTPVPGPSGPSGPTGPSGKEGEDGDDSTVPGPSGVPGSAGSPGQDATGAPGPAGQDGSAGPPGANGAPPAGWTYTDRDGVRYTCAPVDGFDPANPRYVCVPESGGETPPSSPAPGESPMGLATTGSGSERRRR